MAVVFMPDPATGRVGFYDENGTTGDPDDPDSAINAPLNNPFDYFGSLKLHSDCDMFEVAFSGSVTISHAAVAAIAAPAGFSVAYGADAGADDNLLVTHNLGYPPLCLVAVGDKILCPGMFVQALGDASGGARYATAYADSASLRLATVATIGGTNLPAIDLTYSYLVFKAPPAANGDILFDFDPTTGIVQFGKGKVSTDRKYLQVVPGGSPLGMSFGETIDIANGAPKFWAVDGTTYAPVPADLKSYLTRTAYNTTYSAIPGASMAYDGTATGPSATVEVQAP
jgi:hypothetical protein